MSLRPRHHNRWPDTSFPKRKDSSDSEEEDEEGGGEFVDRVRKPKIGVYVVGNGGSGGGGSNLNGIRVPPRSGAERIKLKEHARNQVLLLEPEVVLSV